MNIKNLALSLMLLFSSNIWALTTQEAFKEFYHNEKISFNHCGVNTQLFIQYLKERNVEFKEGYVVSIHDDYATLNHFDARWGSLSRYENGEEYYRSNWYFHVFAIIDGVAYDFSQAGMKTQPVQEYLQSSYIPKSRTENIFFLGHFDKEKALKKYQYMQMKIYDLHSYADNMGPIKYDGLFIELFGAKTPLVSEFDISSIPSDRTFSDIELAEETVTIYDPKLTIEGEEIGLLAYETKICQAFGFVGSMPEYTELSITDKMPALYLYTSFVTDNPMVLGPVDQVRVSHNMRETMGSVERNYFHHAKKVVCSSFSSLFKH